MSELRPIVQIAIGEDKKLIVACDPTAEPLSTPYMIGMSLAMSGRIILEALRVHTNGNPNLMEQAQAEMTQGFVKDMQLPDSPSKVEKV
jgi:hypothetical protein